MLLGADGALAGGPVQGAEVLDFYEDVRAELVEAGVVDDEPVAPDGFATTDESVSDGR